MDKASLTAAFERLGPRRVELGLRAFEDYNRNRCNVRRCFLARAGEGDVRFGFLPWKDPYEAFKVSERRLGGDLTNAVMSAFDVHHTGPILKSQAEEWLEQNREASKKLTLDFSRRASNTTGARSDGCRESAGCGAEK